MSGVRIVYPDANPHIGELMTGARLERAQEVGQFTAHVGQPENDQQFIERIGDANALMLGWGLPVDVMNAAPNLELVTFVGIGAGKFVDLEATHALLDISIDNIVHYYRGAPVNVVAAPGMNSE
ncbi:MAG: hypothetical protein BMS9Abin14_185 [Gammaproteobacteria bacterium]|nr:MAG: hypothetical protein BMS9Abin14_185 [Gammaproteobacteria bacterium]